MRTLCLVAMAALIAATPCIAAEMPSVGSQPPVLSLPNLQNKIVDLTDYSDGPYIISFFTSWSKSCQEELLSLNKIYNENKAKGLKVMGVSFDKKIKPLEEYIAQNEIGFEVLIDKKLKSIDKFAILIIPTTFLIDKNGKIADIYVDFDENVEKSIRSFVETQLSE